MFGATIKPLFKAHWHTTWPSPGPDFWTSYPLVLGFLQVVRHAATGRIREEYIFHSKETASVGYLRFSHGRFGRPDLVFSHLHQRTCKSFLNFWKVIGKAKWFKWRMCQRNCFSQISDDCRIWVAIVTASSDSFEAAICFTLLYHAENTSQMLENLDGVVLFFMRLILFAIVMGVSELAQLGIMFFRVPRIGWREL